jgi:signal transduction histidine kinase
MATVRTAISRAASEPYGRGAWSPAATALLITCCVILFALAVSSGDHLGLGLCVGVPLAALIALRIRDHTRDRRRSVRLRRALDDAIGNLVRVEQTRREQLHDARTAVLALNGASRLLCQPDGVAAATADRLQRMMSAELHRLQDVLAGRRCEPIREFDLAEALAPVIWSHEVAGGPIRSDLEQIRVLGRPEATATAVANLLANARVHAPGSTVTVRAEADTDTVTIIVEDNGPGIPAVERERVLLPGVRASSAPGSGIGLYTAATAMSEQAGTLRVTGREGGGTCVLLTLPAAAQQCVVEPARALAS